MRITPHGWTIGLMAAFSTVWLASPLAAQNSFGPASSPGVPPAGAPRPAEPVAGPSLAETTLQPASTDEGVITIELHDGSRLKGKPIDFDKVTMKTDFGEVTIPIEKIAGIRVSPGYGLQNLGVLLANGDMLHGTVGLDTFKLNTSFGEVAIRGQRLRSIVMSPEWKMWTKHGRTWQLTPYEAIERRVAAAIHQPPHAHVPQTTTYYTVPARPVPHDPGPYAPGYPVYPAPVPSPSPDAGSRPSVPLDSPPSTSSAGPPRAYP